MVTRKLFTTFLFAMTLCGSIFAQQGVLDTTFGTGNTGIYQDDRPTLPLPMNPVNRARYYGINEVLADGKVVVAGTAIAQTPGNSYFGDFVLRRLNADGSVDTGFGVGGDVQTTFFRYGPGVGQQSDTGLGAMKIQPDGKIVVAGICRINGAAGNDTALGSDLCLIRYNANGTIDTSFGGNTIVAYSGNPNFPGTTYTMEAGKVFTLTGTNTVSNATTGFGGTPVKIRIATDGRIFVFGYNSNDVLNGSIAGSRNKSFVAIYSTSGVLQGITSLFDQTGNGTDGYGQTRIYDGDLLSDGSFIAVGQQTRLVSSNPVAFSTLKWVVFRGSNTPNYLNQVNNNPNESAYAIAQLRSNKILIGGGTLGTPTLVRYNGNLTLDTTFGTGGILRYDGTGNNTSIDTFYIGALRTQPDGKILGGTNNGNIARFNPDGSLDRSWAQIRLDIPDSLSNRGVLANLRFVTPFPIMSGTDGRINFGNLSYRPNGKLITAGSVGEGAISGPSGRGVVTQIKSHFRNGGTFNDLNNDGKAEIAVYRPTDGVWHSLDSFTGGYTPAQFGNSTDKIVPADYDGDGKTDRAVFRDGVWYVFKSSNNQVNVFTWGQAGDLPRPGDFNGDGQADFAIFRPAEGNWYIYYSNPIQPGNTIFNVVRFGASGDAPVLGDFDGDGKSDIAVFRNGVWYFIRSGDGSIGIVQFGIAGDVPTVGDYDADGKSDISVFRNGIWYALRSTDGGATIVGWGQAGDRPVPGDYDNDGRSDFAIYRSGVWWILRSSDGGISATQFGLATDIPLQTAYLP